LRGDGRWTEEGVGFVEFRVAGILEIPKHEWNCAEKEKKKRRTYQMMIWLKGMVNK
jgi:hypothetical protein